MIRQSSLADCDKASQSECRHQGSSLVIVLMSTYNGEKFLQQQLESIFRQSRPVDRVIIADDGSTDGTCSLIKGFISAHGLEERWQLQKRKENLGWRRSFFELLGTVNDDNAIVLFSDQDDIWLQGRVEHTASIMGGHPEILCLGCRWQTFDSGSVKLAAIKSKGTGEIYRPQSYFEIYEGEAQSGCLLACRGKLLRIIRQNAAKERAADRMPPYDMYLSRYAFFLGGYYAVDAVWHLHRFHSSNATANRQMASAPKGQGTQMERRAFCQEDCKVLLGLLPLIENQHLSTKDLLEAIAWNEARLGFMDAGKMGSWLQAVRICCKKGHPLIQVAGDLCYRLGIQKIAGRLLHFFMK